MAVSQIEEKILGQLAKETAPTNPLLSASLYQVLGLSILLSRKLYRARKLRKLDITRDTKSLQLYYQIIWLAREGLSITEAYILPYCQDGKQGPECRVMAAKLRASLYHVFCLFHNHPPVNQLQPKSNDSHKSPSSTSPPKGNDTQTRPSPSKSPKSRRRRKSSRSALRDPIPSMNSDTSYVTNPYAIPASSKSPQPAAFDARRTPTRPPGLSPVNVAPAQAAASFLLPPLNFVPMAREYFETAQQLSTSLLTAANALRLSVTLEHAAFLWDCDKEHERARRLARQAIKEVYTSSEGLDDDEFADASALVQALGGIVRRGSADSSPRQPAPSSPTHSQPSQTSPKRQVAPQPQQQQHPLRPLPTIDRTIAVSPPARRNMADSPSQHIRSTTHTPERLSTVPEDPSQETSDTAPTTISPGASRRQSQSRSPAISDKAAKRRAVEQAEELYRIRSNSSQSNRGGKGGKNVGPGGTTGNAAIPSKNGSNNDGKGGNGGGNGNTKRENGSGNISGGEGGDGTHSRQATPPDGSRSAKRRSIAAVLPKGEMSMRHSRLVTVRTSDRQRAILTALDVLSFVPATSRASSMRRSGVGRAY